MAEKLINPHVSGADGMGLVIERGFDPFARWKLRQMLWFYVWVFVVIIPATFWLLSIFESTSEDPTLPGLVSAAIPLLLFAPFVAFWVKRRPNERYQVERFLARREMSEIAAIAGRPVPSTSFLTSIRAVNPFIWFVTVDVIIVSLIIRWPHVGVLALVVAALWTTKQWIDGIEAKSIAVVAEANDMFPSTNLTLDPRYQVGPRSARIRLDISGRFHGRSVHLVSDMASLGGSVVATIELRGAPQFELSERDARWRQWTGADHLDVFTQRFELDGAEASALPPAFIESVVNHDRNLHLDTTTGVLVFRCRSGKVMPFYSLEGVILFLRSLTSLAATLDSPPGVKSNDAR